MINLKNFLNGNVVNVMALVIVAYFIIFSQTIFSMEQHQILSCDDILAKQNRNFLHHELDYLNNSKQFDVVSVWADKSGDINNELLDLKTRDFYTNLNDTNNIFVEKQNLANALNTLSKKGIVLSQWGHVIGKVVEEYTSESNSYQELKLFCRLRGSRQEDITRAGETNIYATSKDAGVRFIPNSGFMGKQLIENYDIDTDNVTRVYTPIDLQHLLGLTKKFKNETTTKKNVVNFIFAGRFVEKKGLPIALQAFKKLVEEYKITDFHFNIIGEGENNEEGRKYEKKLKNMVKELNLSNFISFEPFMNHDELMEKMSEIDIGVACSRIDSKGGTEGFSNFLKEISYWALAVLTNHTDHHKIFNKKKNNGFVAEEGNSESLAKQLFAAYRLCKENRPKFDEMSQNARKTVEETFAPKICYGQLEAVLLQK